MRNVIGQAVVGDDLYGRDYELARLWERLEQGEHILMLAPRRVGKTSLMLELRRAPRGNWNVIYVDVEQGDGPADFVAAVLAALAADHRYRSRFEAIPFSGAVKDVLGHLQPVRVDIGVLRVELKRAIGREWNRAADQLQARLASLPAADANLLIIVDELPFLVSRMLRTAERKPDAEMLLSRLRHWRQAPKFRSKVHTGRGIDRTRRSPAACGPFGPDQRPRTVPPGFVGQAHRRRIPEGAWKRLRFPSRRWIHRPDPGPAAGPRSVPHAAFFPNPARCL